MASGAHWAANPDAKSLAISKSAHIHDSEGEVGGASPGILLPREESGDRRHPSPSLLFSTVRQRPFGLLPQLRSESGILGYQMPAVKDSSGLQPGLKLRGRASGEELSR